MNTYPSDKEWLEEYERQRMSRIQDMIEEAMRKQWQDVMKGLRR